MNLCAAQVKTKRECFDLVKGYNHKQKSSMMITNDDLRGWGLYSRGKRDEENISLANRGMWHVQMEFMKKIFENKKSKPQIIKTNLSLYVVSFFHLCIITAGFWSCICVEPNTTGGLCFVLFSLAHPWLFSGSVEMILSWSWTHSFHFLLHPEFPFISYLLVSFFFFLVLTVPSYRRQYVLH